jgi:glycosyltransferase involved in cell wall biosynthesis
MMSSKDETRPRLLIITRDCFPPFRADITELFSRWLTKRFDIDWVMAHQGVGPAGPIAGAAGERFCISASGLGWLGLQLRQGLRVIGGEAQIVQVRDAAFSAVFFQLMARLGRRPFVYWMSYPIAEGYLYRAGDGRWSLRAARWLYGCLACTVLYRWVLPTAAHVFVQSARMKADVAAEGVSPERITPVPMGASLASYQHIEAINEPRLLGRRTLVYVGALGPERQIENLIAMLRQVVDAGFDAVLVLVGAALDAERSLLDALALRLGVAERLLFTGRLPLAQMLAYVRRAEVCLSPFPVWPPTYLSATPSKLVDYLAMGRPVVATDHPDQRDVIRQSGAGVIVEPTAAAMANAAIALMSDPAAAEAMGARGPAWIAAHRDYAVISKQVAAVYRALLDHP